MKKNTFTPTFFSWGQFAQLIFLCFWGIGVAQAQSIQGKITDQDTKEALPGVSIFLIGTTTGTVTGIDGSFLLKTPAGKHTIGISSVGYQALTREITVAEGQTVNLGNITIVADNKALDEVVVLGTRRTDRTVIESAVPIDVISRKEIESTGFTQTAEILQSLVPSLNSFKNSITDGTDYIRPVNLRGLGSEHVLVLVNGKRRHISPVVNDNEQNRGSVNVDLNSIPASSIERIEVLRDGAAAQYGSDAIAGVINIVLKKSSDWDVGITYGQNVSRETRGFAAGEGLVEEPISGQPGKFQVQTDAQFQKGVYLKNWVNTQEKVWHYDGQTVTAHIGKGFTIGKGFLHASLRFWKQGKSDRAGLDSEYQYFGTLPDGKQTNNATSLDLPTTILDPKEATVERKHWWFGKSQMTDLTSFVNFEYPLTSQLKLYAFSGFSNRTGRGPCFWRTANSNNNVRSIFPDGYLPNITPIVQDYSTSVGTKGKLLKNWDFDLSQTLGYSNFNFKGETLNTSLGGYEDLVSNPDLKARTKFDGGGYSFLQSTSNFDMNRLFTLSPKTSISIATGAEFRYEKYQIYAGELASYSDGKIPVKDGPAKGAVTVAGCQCVPSFSNIDASKNTRSNVGLYLDTEIDVSKKFSFGAASRFENYSDFGSTLTGKLSSRWEILPGLAVRGAISTGFRAPALAQQFYSNQSLQPTATGGLKLTGTFPVSTDIATSIGATPLKAEKSVNISAGTTFNHGNLSITVDAYQIQLNDRIILSEDFQGKKDANGNDLLKAYFQTVAPGRGVEQAAFFTNGLDTKTQGIDITARYSLMLAVDHQIRLTVAANFNKTEITNAKEIGTPDKLAPYSATPLLGLTNRTRMEFAAPRQIVNFIVNYDHKNFGMFVKPVYFGKITTSERFGANLAHYLQKYPGTIIVDLEAHYKVMDQKLTFALGANNLLDTYPQKRFKGTSRSGIFPYSGFVPYGFTGRYVYTRVQFSF